MIYILATSVCEDASFLATILFIKKLIKIMSIIVPAILVLLLSIDMGKAVIAGDDDDIKRAQRLAVKRIIASLIVFFVPIVVDSAFYLVGDAGTSWISCYNDATDEKVDSLVKTQKEIDSKKEKENKKAIEKAKKQNQKKEKEERARRKKAKKKAREQKTNGSTNGGNTNNTGNKYKGKARLNKSYSKITVLDKLTKNNFEILSTVTSTNSERISESFAVVNNYYVVVHVNSINTKAYVGVYDKYTNKRINGFNTSLGHANGTTYNSKNSKLYVTHGAFSRSKVHTFSGSNIESAKGINVKSSNVSRGVSGVAYDDVTGKLYYASGNGIYEYSKGRMKYRVGRKSFLFGTSQDFCVHNGIIYDTRTNGGNTIDIYKVNGAYLGSYKVNISGHEIESIDYYGTGNKMAVLFNHYGNKKNYIYVIDTIIPN